MQAVQRLIGEENQFVVLHFNRSSTDLKKGCIGAYLLEFGLKGILHFYFSIDGHSALF
jgi:hypothetical protein